MRETSMTWPPSRDYVHASISAGGGGSRCWTRHARACPSTSGRDVAMVGLRAERFCVHKAVSGSWVCSAPRAEGMDRPLQRAVQHGLREVPRARVRAAERAQAELTPINPYA